MHDLDAHRSIIGPGGRVDARHARQSDQEQAVLGLGGPGGRWRRVVWLADRQGRDQAVGAQTSKAQGMTFGSWWRQRELWEQALMVAVPGIGIGIGVAALVEKGTGAPLGGFTPFEELPDLLDYEGDQVDEEPPPGIEYDEYDAPCVGLPVATGLEGAEDDGGFCIAPADLVPKAKTEATFARGGPRPNWPLKTKAKRKLQVSYEDVRSKWHGRWGRHFGASRANKEGEKRVHAGVDLFADPGDEVVAVEDGEILAILPFYKGTSALYLLTDSGLIVNYGELEPRSWSAYGIEGGVGTEQKVSAGDTLARVGLSRDGSHMLHIETYEPTVTVTEIRSGAMRWPKGDAPPEGILDPSEYLVRAQRVRYEQMATQT